MKKLFNAVIVLLLVVSLFGVDRLLGNQYKPGTYKGSAQGRKDKKHSGLVEVEVTVSDSAITDIKVVTFEQSKEHKKYGPPATKALNEIPPAILEKQSLEVDVVTKATMSSIAIELAVARALDQALIKKYKPGTYKGSAQGRKDKKHSGLIEVEVKVSDSAITDIKVVTCEQSKEHKTYGKYVNTALDTIPAAILKEQALGADVVVKATMTSNAIELAVARALEKARTK